MELGFLRVASVTLVNRSKITMGIDHLRLKPKRRLEGNRCALVIARASKRDAEVEERDHAVGIELDRPAVVLRSSARVSSATARSSAARNPRECRRSPP